MEVLKQAGSRSAGWWQLVPALLDAVQHCPNGDGQFWVSSRLDNRPLPALSASSAVLSSPEL